MSGNLSIILLLYMVPGDGKKDMLDEDILSNLFLVLGESYLNFWLWGANYNVTVEKHVVDLVVLLTMTVSVGFTVWSNGTFNLYLLTYAGTLS